MKHEIIEKTDTKATIKITLDKDQLSGVVADTFNRLRPKVKASGFRPGKAPDHIIERELGESVVQNEVLDSATSLSYANAVRDLDLEVVAAPKVDLQKFVPYDELEYIATVDVMPQVKLPDYKQIKKTYPEVKIEDKDIEETIESLRKSVAEKKEADRAAKVGDEVVFDFEGTRDGKPVEGAKSEKYPLTLGSKSFIPGFEEELVGLKPGEGKTFTITFPSDYFAKDLAGAKLEFKVKLHQVNELVLPEVNDEFAAKVGPFKSSKELKSDIRSRLTQEKELEVKRGFEQEVIDELVEKTKFEVPESLVHEQEHAMEHDFEHNLQRQGLSMEQYAQMQGKSEEQIRSELKQEAAKRVKTAIILTEIAKAEQLQVSDTELEGEVKRLKGLYTRPETQAELDSAQTQREVRNHLLANKTLETIIKYVTS